MSSSFYVIRDTSKQGRETFASQPSTAGPWSTESQHGSPPAALITRAIERLETGADRVIGRLTMELLGPVPVGPVSVEASVLRPGRSVELCGATLYDEERGRPVATAAAWRFPIRTDGPGRRHEPPAHSPADGVDHPRPASWSGGYLDAVEWRWVKGATTEAGPGVVWMRPDVDLVAGEPMSPLQRIIACVDSASGISAELDPADWAFLNTELTVHVLRPPVGEWICVDAQTTLGEGAVGTATSTVYDEQGLVARTSQALLILRR
ncbi:MAG TPA: thioesterase family protein [Nocardioidaceae bacterium]|nr:thioesterase family protein [Nocardioidaceae bacterium]